MTSEISRIKNESLNTAAIIAVSKKNGGYDDKNIQKKAELNKKITELNNTIKTKETAIASKEFSAEEIKKKKTQGIVNYSLGLAAFIASGVGIFSGIGAGYAAKNISGFFKLSEMATYHITGTAFALGLVATPVLSYLLGNHGGKQINSADKLNKQKSQMQKEIESLRKELEQTQKMLANA